MTYHNQQVPAGGQEWADIERELLDRRQGNGDMQWDSLRNMKASYNAGDDVVDVAWKAYTLFKGDNLLYSGTLYPSLLSLADDVINTTLNLLNAPEGAGGTITTGGTESILLGIRAAYRWACDKRTFSGTPEIVLPYHAHAAFDKAAGLMGIKVVRVPIQNFRGDVGAMSAAITENTFMMAGSATAYPLGHVDPIEGICKLAREHKLWVHVDACVGGFFLPFAAALGHSIPQFDFSNPEVKSISVDLHKYGYTARGASLILLREEDLARYHSFNFSDWPTGSFNTSTLTGSRPAGAVASAWAVINYLGFDGYCERVKKINNAKALFIKEAEAVAGIRSCGNPEGGIVGFKSDDKNLDLFAVRDGMTMRGWQTGVVIQPRGFQILLNCYHHSVASQFGKDLAEVARLVRQGKIQASGSDLSYGG